ncbi:pyruvate kinase [filamentous cyanobacterium CCP5]|nr:pyruvate kinase [filamentous cyanobacterium CCP5]
MSLFSHRTKIVATIGPASDSPETIRQMLRAGMSVARLNFSHGSYDDHAQRIQRLRSLSAELELPLTLLQDLQGPKIRVGELPADGVQLTPGSLLTLVPSAGFDHRPDTVAIDYPYVAEEAEPGTQVLLDDGLLELQVKEIQGQEVVCEVITGGRLKSHKGVNFPSLNLRLPSMTAKDREDLAFGVQQGVDIISLSFVRQAQDVQALKALLREQGASIPVLAKLEKPQAIANLEAIVDECDAIMVARGDLGVEMSPEKVPLIQKRIIRLCNQKGIPVITATQMLDSMIRNPRPTRAEVSDVANAIMDGTDAVMLSGESAVGDYPVEAVQMMGRIATDVEPETEYINHPPPKIDDPHAVSEALNAIDQVLDLHCIVTFTETGHSAKLAAAERPSVPVIAVTANYRVYHQLNLAWGVKPVLVEHLADSIDGMFQQIDSCLIERDLAKPGDKVLLIGGVPVHRAGSTNFLKIHTIGQG